MASADTSFPELRYLVEDLFDVGTKWKAIGIQLELEYAYLKFLEKEHRNDVRYAFYMMLERWLQGSLEPSWYEIVHVLRARSVSEYALASRIEEKRCPARPINSTRMSQPATASATTPGIM